MIPSEVKICGIPHRVVLCKDSFDNSALHLGFIKFAEAEIRINESASAEMQKQTLFHEMLHGMLVLIGRTEEGNDEQFVQSLSLALFNSFEIKEDSTKWTPDPNVTYTATNTIPKEEAHDS